MLAASALFTVSSSVPAFRDKVSHTLVLNTESKYLCARSDSKTYMLFEIWAQLFHKIIPRIFSLPLQSHYPDLPPALRDY